MKGLKSTLASLTTAVLFMGLALNFNACSNSSPISPDMTESTALSSTGPIQILKVDESKVITAPQGFTAPQTLFKYTDISQYYAEKLVLPHKDVDLKIGDDETGESKVEFKKFNLPDTFNVVFEWAGDDSTYRGFLDTQEHPGEDIIFNDSVKIKLSYKMANLIDVDEASIALYMHDQGTGEWEKIGGKLDDNNKRVEAYIHRFGRLALLHIKNGEPSMLFKVQDTQYYDREFIRADDHGKLEVEGEGLDKSFVDIKDYDLPNDMTVTFEWAAGEVFEGIVNSVEYGTSPVFNNPVLMRVSYKNAELLEVNEDSLALYVFDPVSEDWQALESTVDISHQDVEAYLTCFGQIALFYTESGSRYNLNKLGENVFYAKKFVKESKGGTLHVGNKNTGKTKIKFKKHDLPYDAEIRFEWAASATLEGSLSNLHFGPHGLNFNNPVEVELSYKLADLSGIEDETLLQVYYLNEETGIWELIGGIVDANKKMIKVYLNHFSRYAIGAE